ncbi:glycosyltransferase [candidate division KSB1 bacterium]|nr:glycosyltransferase [candidate division KSB1 bacterium]
MSDKDSVAAISVIIPVYNDARNLDRCLNHLFLSAFDDFECIVIDDGSTDDSAAVARCHDVKLIQISNSGPAAARNHGVRKAGGRILFFIDADVLCHQDTLEKVYQAFQRDNVDAVFGSYDDEPAHNGMVSQFKNLYHHFTHQTAREEAHTFWAGCGAVRREVFLNMDGFNTKYRKPMIEDIELGYRLTKAGYSIRLVKALQVKHLKKWTLIQLIKTDVFQRGIPWTVLMLQNRRFQNDLNVSKGQRLCVSLVFSLVLLFFLPPLCGLFYAFFVILAVILFNLKLYRFFLNKRGMVFSIKALFLHLLYYLYSGISFLIGNVQYHILRRH